MLIADPIIVEAWVKGWTLSRRTPPPVATDDGWRVEVGLPEQRARHVLPRFDPDRLQALATRLTLPWTYLKVCAPIEDVAAALPKPWTIGAPIHMMATSLARVAGSPTPPSGYGAHLSQEESVIVATLLDDRGELAARGRMALTETHAVFDQIVTEAGHRRRGLGGVVMSLLSRQAARRGIGSAVLVATEDGRALYNTLGWTLHSPMTSCVVPGQAA